MNYRHFLAAGAMLLAAMSPLSAQQRLYPNEFSLSDVQLLDGPFKHACDLNVDVLLQYDVDRLLAPFRKRPACSPRASFFQTGKGLTDMWADTIFRLSPFTMPQQAMRSLNREWIT